MAGITLEQAEAKLTYWLGIEERLGVNQSSTIDGTSYTRHDLPAIRDNITIWDSRVKQLSRSASGGRSFRCIEAAN